MKIAPINNLLIKNNKLRQNEAESKTSIFVSHDKNKPTEYIDKRFYIANSNISFKGYECSPSKFIIKSAFGIDCPCCGQTMLTKKQSNAFVSRISKKTGEDLATELNKEYRYFRKNEQEIVDILMEDTKKYPEYDLTTLVAHEAENSMAKLVKNQKQLIEQMREDSLRLSMGKREELCTILSSEENLIDNSDDFVHFKRRNFVDKIYNFKDSCTGHDAQIACEVFEKALKMPTSATSKDAFFVKYARRKNEDIARRLILPAMSTTEHIKPQSKNGKNSTDNYIPLCGDCNSKRGNIPYSEWFKIHPEMPQNLQNYIYQVSAIIDDENYTGIWDFYDTYTDDVIKAIYEETRGTVKLLSAEEAKEKGLIDDDFEQTVLPSKKPKTLEEKREIWMEKYESLTARKNALVKLRDELYSNEEFINIVAFVKNRELLNSAEKTLKIFEENKNQAKNALNRINKAYKSALSKNEPTDELEAKLLEKQGLYESAKEDYEQQAQRVEMLNQKLSDLKNNGVVTPDELASEINRNKIKLQNFAGADALNINAEFEISDATSNIESLQRRIDTLTQLNSMIKHGIDFNSSSSKRAKTKYQDLTGKIKAINEVDRSRFRQFFANNGTEGLNPEFILDEALSSLQKQFAFLMKNTSALYIKREDDIKELQGQKDAYEIKLDKMKEISKMQAQIRALEKRRNAVAYKFANININETIEKLQKEADEYLQYYTDSYEEDFKYSASDTNQENMES